MVCDRGSSFCPSYSPALWSAIISKCAASTTIHVDEEREFVVENAGSGSGLVEIGGSDSCLEPPLRG